MDKETLVKLAENIEKHLATYQELAMKRKTLEERLEKAEQQKDTVKDRVFQKVCEEYQHQLAKLAKELAPMEADVEEARKAFPDELEQIEALTGQLEEKVEEFEFRYRVGEYSDNEFSNMATPLQEQAAKLSKRGDWLSGILKQVEEVVKSTENGSPGKASPTTSAKAADKAQKSASQDDRSRDKSSPAKPSADKQTATRTPSGQGAGEEPEKLETTDTAGRRPKESNLVDPSEWMDEILFDDAPPQPDKPQKTVQVTDNADTGSRNDDDPLAKLADASEPAPAKASSPKTTQEPSAVGTKEKPKSFPVLIITKGPGSGKKLPLLPMTMTLGREHDNNIELKDEDVARYHARIVYKKGEFCLEDLDSSSGTWVNDERIKEAVLNHGDKIRVGGTELMIDFE